MGWQTEIANALIIAVLYLIIFVVAELGRYYRHIETEKTRKFVHLTSGIIALSFGYLFKFHWTVLILCSGFALILVITKKLDLLKSIHDVDRESKGGIYYPVAVYITFVFASIIQKPEFYFLSILVLAISDTLAALIGKKYGFNVFRVEEDTKSVEGSLIFFLMTFLILLIGLKMLTDLNIIIIILSSIYITILVTSFEAISLCGADNIFIPT
ncbi:MAG: hypothetical protein AB1782_20670, partial [Cyanobacteriota bacterium]